MKLPLAKNLRAGLIAFCTILVLVSSFLLTTAVQPRQMEQTVPKLKYDQSSTVNYRVFFLPNNLYQEKNLASGKVYMTNYVDYINTYLAYQFSSEQGSDVKGSYDVKATLAATMKDLKNPVWQRDYVLLPSTQFVGAKTGPTLERELAIKISDLNNFVKKTIEETKFTPNSVSLTVRWNINVEAQTKAGVVKDQVIPTMVIPLGSTFFEVGGELEKKKPGVIEEKIMTTTQVNRMSIILYSVLTGIGLLGLAGISLFTIVRTEREDIQQKKVNEILKQHGDRLVALDGDLDMSAAKGVIPVRSMEDLVRVADEVGRPILYRYTSRGKVPITFYVMDEPNCFVYAVKPLEESLQPPLPTNVPVAEGKKASY